MAPDSTLGRILDSGNPELFRPRTKTPGPEGVLPLTADRLRGAPSGDLFGWSQNVGMGWRPGLLDRPEVLLLSTQGGIRRPDGSPLALGYHTGHWEVGLLMEAAAETLSENGAIPFAGFCSDPCDGRTQGTSGMMDSLAWRNDAAVVLRRLIRSLPTRRGVIGIATCDKGHPAMMMALAGSAHLPSVLVPGGVTLPPEHGEDAGKVQTIGARFAHGLISLEEAAEAGCRACASPGGGCQFLGTAATSQVVGEALGLSLPHSALAPSGSAVWLDGARRAALAVLHLLENEGTLSDVLTAESVHNAMVVHAAFGGSTNLLLHLPAVAHAAGLPRPTVDSWRAINRRTPRLVSVLPNGPEMHPTVRVFLAGGVPEVMLHLRNLGLLNGSCRTVSGLSVDETLDWWEASDRRRLLRDHLAAEDGVDPDDVILYPDRARGLLPTLVFPGGNLAPDGAVVKTTSIDPLVLDDQGRYHHVGPARVFTSERAAVEAIKATGPNRVREGDVLVLAGVGPMGTGMEETYQVTSALRHLPWGNRVTVLTDARFSGVSTGACIGHIAPEALAGGPIGRLRDGDLIDVFLDPRNGEARIDLIGESGHDEGAGRGADVLAARPMRDDVAPHIGLPADTRLWAILQGLSGGAWGGCVYDVDAIAQKLESASAAVSDSSTAPTAAASSATV